MLKWIRYWMNVIQYRLEAWRLLRLQLRFSYLMTVEGPWYRNDIASELYWMYHDSEYEYIDSQEYENRRFEALERYSDAVCRYANLGLIS